MSHRVRFAIWLIVNIVVINYLGSLASKGFAQLRRDKEEVSSRSSVSTIDVVQNLPSAVTPGKEFSFQVDGPYSLNGYFKSDIAPLTLDCGEEMKIPLRVINFPWPEKIRTNEAVPSESKIRITGSGDVPKGIKVPDVRRCLLHGDVHVPEINRGAIKTYETNTYLVSEQLVSVELTIRILSADSLDQYREARLQRATTNASQSRPLLLVKSWGAFLGMLSFVAVSAWYMFGREPRVKRRDIHW